jgi:hypothetical protein
MGRFAYILDSLFDTSAMSPRIIQLPLSGLDRRHYARELKRAEELHASLVRRLPAAFSAADEQFRQAHRMTCEEWNARQFIGGPADPSPTIADAIHAGIEMLEVRCKRCGHADLVDLMLVVWPRANQVHTLERGLGCQPCKSERRSRSRPDLVGLRMRNPTDTPTAPAVRKRGVPDL